MTGKIVINSERCKGCFLCVKACPRHLIKASKKTNSFGQNPAEFDNSDKCTACALCAYVCPDVAIDVYKNGE